MLPRSQRLSVSQFEEVMKKGRIIHSSLFVMRALKVAGPARIAAVAPQKIAKTAVARNKMRRRIYEAVAPLYSRCLEGNQIIIFAKSGAMEADLSVIKQEIGQIFVKAGLMK